MDEFSYLSVLLSIIIGLAVTEILQGFRERMLARARIKEYWPTRLWAGTLLLVSAQTWWAMFDLRNRHNWEFSQFLTLLGQAIALYLVAGLVFPKFPEKEVVDLREHYFAHRKPFFSLLIASAALSICRDLVLNHALPARTNLAFHAGYIALALAGIFVANEKFHKALAVITAIAFVEYVITLFTRLPQ